MYLPIAHNPRAPETIHSDRAGEALMLGPLAGQVGADIVVIGGGIAGSSAALHAAEHGADVVMLEANEIGWGASSRNAGHVAPATKLLPQEVERRYRSVFGPRLNDAAESGPDFVFGLVEKHGIDACAVKNGVIVAAHTPKALKALEERANYLRSRGEPVEMLDYGQAATVIGSGFYLGAFLDKRGGTINPLTYVRGLLRAAIKAGARIYERSKALRINRTGSGWSAETDIGLVQAKRVLICTNAYSDDLWPGLRQTIVLVRAYQLASGGRHGSSGEAANDRYAQAPSGAAGQQRLPHPLWRYRSRFRTRNTARHLGIDTAPARNLSADPSGQHRSLVEWLDGLSPSKAWQMHELAPGVLAAIGCNGRGVAIATFLGREIAAHAMGKPRKDLVIPLTPPARVPLHRFHQPLVNMLVRHHAIRDELECRALRRTVRALNVSQSK